VAASVLFLATPASSYTTGELLKVDGGLALSSWFNMPQYLAQYMGGSRAGSSSA
jgi:enoyl-[acyl-carrier-protein] reductase (NADH)